MASNLFDPTATQRDVPEGYGQLRVTADALRHLESFANGPERLTPWHALDRLMTAPVTMVLRVKGGGDIEKHVAGRINARSDSVRWNSERVVLDVPAHNRGRLVGLAVRNGDGLVVASERYRRAIPLPVGGSRRTVTVEPTTAIAIRTVRDDSLGDRVKISGG